MIPSRMVQRDSTTPENGEEFWEGLGCGAGTQPTRTLGLCGTEAATGIPIAVQGKAGEVVTGGLLHGIELSAAGPYIMVLGDSWGGYDVAARGFASKVRHIDASAKVWGKLASGALDLWVVLAGRTPELERAVAEQLCDLMRGYPYLRFDFMMLDSDEESARSAADSGYVLLS